MRPVASCRTVVVVAVAFLCCAAGCASDSGGGDDGNATVDGGAADGASVGSDAAEESGASEVSEDAAMDAPGDDAPIPELPPCTLACDRVVDCATEACSGVDWRTAGLAYTACAEACGDLFAERILEAESCDTVMDYALRQSADLDTLCEADICELACEHFADCVIEGCLNFDENRRGDLVNGCMNDCTDEDSGDMLNASCQDLMSALSADEQFMRLCQEPPTCAGEELCGPYSEKVGGCLVEQCNGNADPFAAGLREALFMFCLDDQDCVTNVEAGIILSESVTCQSDELRNLGSDPLFEPMCTGTVGASHDELMAVCNALLGCGIDLGSADRCAVLLALDATAASIVECVNSAAGCLAVFACMGAP